MAIYGADPFSAVLLSIKLHQEFLIPTFCMPKNRLNPAMREFVSAVANALGFVLAGCFLMGIVALFQWNVFLLIVAILLLIGFFKIQGACKDALGDNEPLMQTFDIPEPPAQRQ